MNCLLPIAFQRMTEQLRTAMALLCVALILCVSTAALAQSSALNNGSREVTQQATIWIDQSGAATVEQLVAAPERFRPIGQSHSFALTPESALWMRIDLPAANTQKRWYLQLSSATFFNQASLYQRSASGQWKEQLAGDRHPVAKWEYPEQTPVFLVDLQTNTTLWLRLADYPAPIAPRLQLLSQDSLDTQRRWSFLLIGGYLGFGILVLFLGIVHARLYGDRAFVAYSAYVAFMLLFQMAYTGIGGLYFWPNWAAWNNAAPAIFMLLLTSAGIWFVREACAIARYSKFIDKAVLAWVAFGVLFTVVYTSLPTKTNFLILNLYGLLSVLLSITLCFWVWRNGERYGGWLFLGFLPVHLGYPFAALRSSGLIADNWLSQYAVLIGSAIEIPLLLYILHLRAKEFSENRARMRAIDHADPLTGLAISPVLTLRMRDALRRSSSQGNAHHALVLIELANHASFMSKHGRLMGDRALVVSASCLQSFFADLDTVCRIDETRFAVLISKPINSYALSMLAQRLVARGLIEQLELQDKTPLRFRVVTSPLYRLSTALNTNGEIDLDQTLQPLSEAMNRLANEPKKFIVNLNPFQQTESDAGATPA
jgi:two-component system, sensor histidine kinase LadS